VTQQQTAGPPAAGHADPAEEFLDRQTPLSRIRNILHRYPALSPAIVLLVAVVVFGLLNERFLRVENLSLITQQVSVVGTLAIAQTLIILTAGIDLSVGAVMILHPWWWHSWPSAAAHPPRSLSSSASSWVWQRGR
jgi:fructose transport system permease protein